jgi:SAM-dependent methyltransferase
MTTPESTHASRGYVLDTRYPETYFQALSPAWLNYARAVNGVPARSLDEPFAYLELGAGTSHSTVVHAASCPRGEFHACDFNPEHIEGGRRFASALGLRNIELHEASFEQLQVQRLPKFDFIVLHGVYSWVDAKARAAIRNIIRETLGPGGLVYVSYNCMPGWTSELPVRRMLVELAASAPGESDERMEHAVRSLRSLIDGGMRFFENHPEALRAVEAYEKAPASYLAHEFLNAAWEPFYAIDVAAEMAGAGTRFLGSATLADNHPMLVIGDAAASAMKALATPGQQHLAIDFATNRRFRRDLFIRDEGARSRPDARAFLGAIIGSIEDPRRLGTGVTVPRGHITFQPDFIDELRTLLDDGAVTIADAAASLGRRTRNTTEIIRNLAFLVAGGALSPFAKAYRRTHPPEVHRPANAIVERTLAYILENRMARALPSELLGGGVPVTPLEAHAIIELLGGADPAALASRLRTALSGELRAPEELSRSTEDVVRHVTTTLLPNLARLQLVV